MVEAARRKCREEEIVQALELAHAAIKDIVAGIDALAKDAGQDEEASSPRRRSATTSIARSRRRSTCR